MDDAQPRNDAQITDAAMLVVASDGKIIAFARKGNLQKLGLPAGKREPGESVQAAAQRELFEEMGLQLPLTGSEQTFTYRPDDKQAQNLQEFCTTYIVHLPQTSSEIPLSGRDLNNHGESKGFGLWVTPQEFVAAGNSAFEDYNTTLLKKAGLI